MRTARLERDGEVLVPELRLATGALARMRGLLGRTELAPGEGMWLAPCSAVHTVGMRFAIDAIFLDAAGHVLRIAANLPPGRVAWGGWAARSCVEVPAGWSASHAILPGQRILRTA